jgi:hypothetical protein
MLFLPCGREYAKVEIVPAFRKIKKGRGRPPRLPTPEITAIIVSYLRIGAYIETAAVVAGIGKKQFYEWMKKGAKGRGIFADFRNAVDAAVEECTLRDLAVIDNAANPKKNALLLKDENGIQLYDQHGLPLYIEPLKPDWGAASWRLERRKAREWSKLEKHEHSGPEGAPITAEETAEEREARQKRVAEKLKRLNDLG